MFPDGAPLPLRGGVGVGSLISLQRIFYRLFFSAEKVTDPTPAPPLEGRGVATAGEGFLGQLLYHYLKKYGVITTLKGRLSVAGAYLAVKSLKAPVYSQELTVLRLLREFGGIYPNKVLEQVRRIRFGMLPWEAQKKSLFFFALLWFFRTFVPAKGAVVMTA